MTGFNVYRLHFTTPVHISDYRSDYDTSLKTVSSDTLYAAVISCLAKLGMEIPEDGDIGCTVSSLFPFYRKTNGSPVTYFLPKPTGTVTPEKRETAKKIKKINWLDIPHFQKLISGHLDASSINESSIKGKEFLTKDNIADDFILSQVAVHASVSRTGEEETVPYYMDRIHFKDNSGLYFIAEGDTVLLEKGLDLLQYEGIGTDRNVGNGYFTYEKEENAFSLELPVNSEKSVALSMYIPASEEELKKMLEGECAFDLVRRGGWITTAPFNSLRKNTVYAFTPGSVFSVGCKYPDIKGKIADLAPKEVNVGHSIWRNGKSLFIPANI